MLKHERFEYILKTLSVEQRVDASTVSKALQVSEATIRRDLTELDTMGKIRKVHGGAILANHPVLSFEQRKQVNQEVKQIIAQKALPLLHNGQVMLIDGGTTNLQLVRLLPVTFQATVITNSPAIAQQLSAHAQVEVILTGGTYLKTHDVLVGASTFEMIRTVYADLCLLGVCSMHATQGITISSYEEALVKKAMVHSSVRIIALTHSEKIGQCESFKVCETNDIDTLITELSPDDEKLSVFHQRKIEVI